MKTLVGVDPEGTYRSSVNLCKRLQFPNQEWTLANTIPPIPWYVPGLNPRILPVADILEYQDEASKELLKKAHEEMGDEKVSEKTVEGDAAAALMRIANGSDVDLIVLGSGQPDHGVLWAIGSVSRALCIGAKQSLLIAKGEVRADGPIHAVFATDHSEYAKAAVDQLIKWAPKGFKQIDVVSAYEINPATMTMLRSHTDVDLDFEKWVHDQTLKEAKEVAEKLHKISPLTTVTAQMGDPNFVIRETMAMSKADLLIVGAQGHGFFERLLVGSVSHHQVVAEPYPVLLIRLPNFSKSTDEQVDAIM